MKDFSFIAWVIFWVVGICSGVLSNESIYIFSALCLIGMDINYED